MFQNQVNNNTFCFWAIVIVRDGDVSPVITFSNGGDFLNPEQNVLAYGLLFGDTATLDTRGPTWSMTEGSTKTMRKMKGGDKILFMHICTGGFAISGSIIGVIQFFVKS